MIYKMTTKRQVCGHAIGVLQFGCASGISIPGAVGNATTYKFPVLYRAVEDFAYEDVFEKKWDKLPNLIAAAKWLEDQGVRAITANCGFFALYQNEIAKAVSIPVFLSSLLQVPFMYQCIAPQKKVGILTANSKTLDKDFLRAAGINDDIPIVIRGMQDKDAFRAHVLEEKEILDTDTVCQEVLEAVEEMLMQEPSIGTLLLECTEFPPYAYKIQQRFPIPIFDFSTMIQYMFTAVIREPFVGFV